jgi:hypothetical protein
MWYVVGYGVMRTYLVTASQVLEIKGGEFSWSKDAQTPALEGIDLVARKGELTGIVGRVGAGKVCCLHNDVSFRLNIIIAVESPFGDHRGHASD